MKRIYKRIVSCFTPILRKREVAVVVIYHIQVLPNLLESLASSSKAYSSIGDILI